MPAPSNGRDRCDTYRSNAALRRSPAAAARPDPARALDSRLRLDQGAARAGRPRRCSASAPRRRRSRRSSGSTASTTRSTSSTGVTSGRRRASATSGTSISTPAGSHGGAEGALPRHDRARGRGDDLRDRARASRSATSPPSATAASVDQRAWCCRCSGVSIPIFFLAILLKYVFAIKLGLAYPRWAASRF